MKFSISREMLIGSLQLVSSSVAGRHPLPVLLNLLVEVKDGTLSLTGSDSEVEMNCTITLEGDSTDGRTTIPARKFLDICKGLAKDAKIQLQFDDQKQKAIVKSGRSRYTLSCLNAQDYPSTGEWQVLSEISMPQGDLKKTIDSTQFSMANQDVRYYLNGMLLEAKGGKLTTVATDGHRLSTCSVDINNTTNDQSIIIPRKGVAEILKLIGDDQTEMTLQIGQNNIRITVEGHTFTCKLIDGRYPDYTRVIPKNANNVLTGNKEMLKQAFKRASVLSNEKFNGVRIDLTNNSMKVTAANPSREEAEEHIDINYDGEAIEVGFNVGYILDALSNMKGDEVQISLRDGQSSAIVESAGQYEGLSVLMPMRL